MNQFKTFSASQLYDAIESVMPHPDDVGDDRIWVEYALDFLEAFLPAIVWQTNNKGLALNAGIIREAISFGNVITLAQSETMPANIRQNLQRYLDSLPSYNEIETFDLNDANYVTSLQQHGYRTLCLWKPLDYLQTD